MSGPERLQQMHFSFAAERVLSTSLKFDVFSHIAAGKKTAGEIFPPPRGFQRGMRVLLPALVGVGFLPQREGRV